MNKVFISYAKEDFQHAEELYCTLKRNGFDPWLDKMKLLPGQDWDFYIQQELRKADFIVLLLSNNSVVKRGYVQREFNSAIIYCQEKLESDIYIIPIKLDACEVPSKLSKFQWIEYSAQDANLKILQALNSQVQKTQNAFQLKSFRPNGLELYEKRKVFTYGEKKPRQFFEATYKVFKKQTSEDLNEINIIIENLILEGIFSSRDNYFNFLVDLEIDPNENENLFHVDSTYYGKIDFHLVRGNLISFTTFWSIYNSGAAHGNYGASGNNYLCNPLRRFSFDQVISNFENNLGPLRDCIHNKLMQKARQEFEIENPSEFYLYNEGLLATTANFKNYYIKDGAVVFIYNPYHLTAWAFGDHHIEVPFDEFTSLYPKDIKLNEFVKWRFRLS